MTWIAGYPNRNSKICNDLCAQFASSKLTKEEAEALKKFRPLAVNLCNHEEEMEDENLLKWLRARDFNVKAAEDLLRKAMIWRRENKIDDIWCWQPPTEILMDFPYDTDGEDREGYLVFVIPFGRWGIRRAFSRGQKDVVLKYFDQMLEKGLEKARMKNMTDPAEKFINQVFFIWDMEGLTMREMAAHGMVDAALDMCRKLEGHYPEIMKTSITVNAPRIFALLFTLIKPILTQQTLDKVQIYGANSNKWKPVLEKYIAEDQLLEKYGGTRKAAEDFLEVTSRDFSGFDEDIEWNDESMCMVTVEAGEEIHIALDVKHPNSILK